MSFADFRAAKHRKVELFKRDAEPLRRGDQLPGESDSVLFEVVAEGEIAEHLEKSVVAIGEAHILKIVVLASGAHAFLAGRGAHVVALLEAEKNVLELVHPRVGEKQRGIVRRDERRTAHDAVPALLEEFQKCLANFVTGQNCPQV